jgi:hypothetical protein
MVSAGMEETGERKEVVRVLRKRTKPCRFDGVADENTRKQERERERERETKKIKNKNTEGGERGEKKGRSSHRGEKQPHKETEKENHKGFLELLSLQTRERRVRIF